MRQQENVYMEDELSLWDVINFFRRQKSILLRGFVVFYSIVLLVAITRPTVYLTEVDLLLGRSYLSADAQIVRAEQGYKPSEAIEQTKYIYGKEAEIDNVRNTNIIKIKVENESKTASESIAKKIVTSIIDDEKKQLEMRKTEFVSLLKAISVSDGSTKQVLDMLNEASKSYNTKILSNETIKLTFSGQLKQILGLGFVLSGLLAFCVAFIRDQLNE